MDDICRTCLRSSERLLSMLEDAQLPHKIETISSVQVLPNDNLPINICAECIVNINLSYNFRKLIINSDLKLRNRLVALSNKKTATDKQFHRSNTSESFSDDDETVVTCLDGIKPEKIEIVVNYKCENFIPEDNTNTSDEYETDIEENSQDNLDKAPLNQDCFSKVYPLNTKNNKIYRCRLCDFSHTEYNFLRRHKRIHWLRRVVCTVCGKSMKIDSLRKHMRIHAHKKALMLKEDNKSTDTNKGDYGCNKCDYKCSDYNQLRGHKRIHVMDFPKSVCNVCGKAIRTDNLKKHMLVHTGPTVSCKVCGKTCKNTESLRGHMLVHKSVKLQCSICGKVYSHRSGYAIHMKRHARGDVKTIECQVCSKRFHDQQTFKKHMRSHTGERPYPCEYCKKGFSSSYALKTHKRRHTNERPYTCEFCPAAFPQKVSLKTHLKSKHPTENILNIVNS